MASDEERSATPDDSNRNHFLLINSRAAAFLTEERDRLTGGGPRDGEILKAALGYWYCYPIWLEAIGWGYLSEQECAAGYLALNSVHEMATKVVMAAVDLAGLDSGSIHESATICVRYFRHHPDRLLRSDGFISARGFWPDCLPWRDDEIDANERTSIRQSVATLQQAELRWIPPTGEGKPAIIAICSGNATDQNNTDPPAAETDGEKLERLCESLSPKGAVLLRFLFGRKYATSFDSLPTEGFRDGIPEDTGIIRALKRLNESLVSKNEFHWSVDVSEAKRTAKLVRN